MPSTIGVVNTPDCVASTPPTICKNNGNMMPTVMVNTPLVNCDATVKLKVRSRNSRMGRIGSLACCSARTNASNATTPSASSASIFNDVNPSRPPNSAKSTNDVTHTIMVIAPA